ncbi:transposase [Streptomyces sp. NBC_01724]|uniref:transposase n=1 Tax=Streptomyces sp. NBC_01724 TaxID=2975922 RepID=UPI003FCE968E
MGAGRDPEPSAAVIDAQSIKTSEGGEARGFDAGKRTTGRKRHVIVDTRWACCWSLLSPPRPCGTGPEAGPSCPARRRLPHDQSGVGRRRMRQLR